jgi:hypothetical protein
MKQRFRAIILSGILVIGLFLLFSQDRVSGEESSGRDAEVKGVSTADPYFGNLKVFSGPSTQSTVKGFLSNGDTVKHHETNGNLARVTCVKFPEGGWVWGSYVQLKDDDQEYPGGVTLPQLLKKETTPPASNQAERLKLILPRADERRVASFIQDLSPAAE